VIVVKNFYVRRALRLFPALMVCFAVAWALDADGFRSSTAWHFMPTSNIYFAIQRQWTPWVISHLWSLNLLEQFYLIWPLVILLLSEKMIYTIILFGLAVLTVVHTNAEVFGIDGWWLLLLLSFDPILTGALVYLLQRHQAVRRVMTSRWAIVLALSVLASPLLLRSEFGQSEIYRILAQPSLAVLVVGAYHGYRGPVGWLLQSPAAQFLSMISYGVYVYHMMVWYVLAEAFPALYVPGPVTFIVISTTTVAIATLSWYGLEAPINRFRQSYPMRYKD
jgi:peptidoglycan/LPS O-acetylase OafA/YrhL